LDADEQETWLSSIGGEQDSGEADDDEPQGEAPDDRIEAGEEADDDHRSLTAESTEDEDDDENADGADSSSGFDEDHAEEGDGEADPDTDDGDGDEEDDPDPVEDALDRLVGDKRSGTDKRVAQLTARSKKAEARVKEMEAELNRLREQAQRPDAGPTDEETTQFQGKVEQEGREVQQAKHLLRQLDTDPDSVAEVLNKVFPERRFNADEEPGMREFLEKYQDYHEQARADSLAELKARRRDWARQQAAEKQQWDGYAAENFPWLADPKDARRKEAARLLGAAPDLRGHKAGLLMAALLAQHFVAKSQAAKARSKQPGGAGGNGKVRPKGPSKGAPPATSRLQGGGQEAFAGAMERLKSNPDDESAALAAYGALATTSSGGSGPKKRNR